MSDASTADGFPAIPFTALPGLVSADGVYLVTAGGQRSLDAGGQACVSNIGYGRAEVADVAAKALLSLTHALPPVQTPQRIRLVQRLTEAWLPPELHRIHFVNSGSEAVDAAIRLARQHHLASGRPGKWKVIGREASYHGVTIGALGVSGHTQRRRGLEPLLSTVPLAPACYPLRCRHCASTRRCSLQCAEGLEALIEREGADSIAAFIAEPIVGTSGGALVPPDDYWPRVQEICRRHQVLLIVDEVITGFGRTGRKFAFQHWDLKPDMVLVAKGFTGGYAALAALITTQRVIGPLLASNQSIMFHTFGGHPAACAVADKVLEILEREALVERAAQLGVYLANKLSRLRAHPQVAEVRGRGLLWAVEIVRNKTTLEQFPETAGVTLDIIRAGVERGVLFYFGGTGEHRDVICIAPAFVITTEEIDRLVEVLEQSIDAVVANAMRPL